MPAAAPLLSAALRAATAEAHQRMEDALDLLSAPLKRDRYLRALEGFYGFHRAWEPAVTADPALGALLQHRSRLADLRSDLQAMGRSDAEIDALPACPDAAGLAAPTLEGLGSLYVIEGSALGGQVIARALAQTLWAPSGGLRYFNPAGGDTGPRWRAFKAALDGFADPAEGLHVIAGATATFDTLRVWLTRA